MTSELPSTETEVIKLKKSLDELKEGLILLFAMPRKHGRALVTAQKHQETTKETPEKHPVNTKEILLQSLREHPESSVRTLPETLNMSAYSVRHHLRQLQGANRIRHRGPTKDGYGEVID